MDKAMTAISPMPSFPTFAAARAWIEQHDEAVRMGTITIHTADGPLAWRNSTRADDAWDRLSIRGMTIYVERWAEHSIRDNKLPESLLVKGWS